MKNIVLDITDNGYGILECPICHQDYLHQGKIHVYTRDKEDAEIGTHVSVAGHDVGLTNKMAGNPSDRRQGITIEFYCEICEETANIPVLGIWQDRGNTHIGWVDEDKWQKWQRNPDDQA